MVKEKTWEEFRASGLLWFINHTLHMFGWAIVIEVAEGKVVRAYPARVKFRGFSDNKNSDGFKKVTKYLKENIDELEEECQ